MRICRGGFAAALLSACALAQSATPKVEFEGVSIKPSEPPGENFMVGCRGGPGSDDPGMIRCTKQDMLNLISHAYALQLFQIVGKSGAGGQRFEIAARLPA